MSEPTLKDLLEGRLIERRYRLMRLLSEGNFGGVFHARLEIFGEPVRDVAVKITKKTHLNKEDAKNVFAEAITLARIYDRITDASARGYIVPIHDLGILEEHEGRGFIVMGLIYGPGSTPENFRPPDTLEDEIQRHRRGMPPEVALEFFRQICTGMAAVHDLNVVHRDLKPDNILLTDRGQIRIVDFGLAAGLSNAGLAAGYVGTHRYMAPETALHGHCDPRSDVYTLGIVLYEMLAGQYPFDKIVAPSGNTPEQRVRWVVDQKRRVRIEPPSARNRMVEPWLDRLVMECLAFRPEDGRPKDAGELLRRLREGPESPGGEIQTSLNEADKLTKIGGWRAWLGAKPKWAEAGAALERAAGQCGGVHDARWFDVNTRLLLCLIHLNMADKALEVLARLDPEIAKGAFLASYQQREDFYETLARAVDGRPGMGHWAVDFKLKAAEARRKGGLG